MKTTSLLILFLLAGIYNRSYAQKYGQNRIDSLLFVLKNENSHRLEMGSNSQPEDTNKVNLLLDLSLTYVSISPDEGLNYADQALLLAKKLGWKKGIAFAEMRKGNNYSIIKDSANKIACYQEALRLFEELKDTGGIIKIFNNYGNLYQSLNEHSKALEYYKKSYELSYETGLKEMMAVARYNTGYIYFNLGNYPEALKEFFAVLKINEETGNKTQIAKALFNIGNIYSNQNDNAEALNSYQAGRKIYEEIGDKNGIAMSLHSIANVYLVQGDTLKALNEFVKSVKINEEIDNKENLAMSHASIARIYDEQGRYRESLKEILTALPIAEESGNKRTISYVYGCIGWGKTRVQQFSEAKEWIIKGLNLANEIGAKEDIKNGYARLAAVDSMSGNYKDAWKNYKLFILYRDSLNNAETTKKSVQIEMQHEFDKKEAATKAEQEKKTALANAEIQRQKVIKYAGFSGLLLVLLLSFGLYKRFLEKKKANIVLEKTLRDLKSTQAQLMQSERMAAFGIMAARVAHEIQNPLNFVNNFSELSEELIQDINSSPDKDEREEATKILKGNLQKIKQHGKQAEGIVKQLLEHTRAGTAHEFFEDNKTE